MLGVDGLERLLAGPAGRRRRRRRAHRARDPRRRQPRDDIAVLVLRATGEALRARPRGPRARGLARARARAEPAPARRAHAPAVARAAVEGSPRAASRRRSRTPRACSRARSSRTASSMRQQRGRLDRPRRGALARRRARRGDRSRAGLRGRPGAPGPRRHGGRGLFLVDALADRWGSADGGTRVWFEVDRPPRDEPRLCSRPGAHRGAILFEVNKSRPCLGVSNEPVRRRATSARIKQQIEEVDPSEVTASCCDEGVAIDRRARDRGVRRRPPAGRQARAARATWSRASRAPCPTATQRVILYCAVGQPLRAGRPHARTTSSATSTSRR